MSDINYFKARKIIPIIAEMEIHAEEKGKNYDPQREKELYEILHSEEASAEMKQAAEAELIEKNLVLVFEFLKSFRYCVDKAETFEDMMQEGFAILIQAVPKWDIEKGCFRAICKVHLNKLYRYYYKEVTLRPQTGLQNDAAIRRYDNETLMKKGELDPPEEVAKILGKSVKAVKAARKYKESQSGNVYSIEGMKVKFASDQTSERILNRRSETDELPEQKLGARLLDKEFIQEARMALINNKYEERLIFDFLVMQENWDLPGKEFAEVIRKATGYNFSYQQIYRAKQNIGATLIHKGILSRSFVKQNAKRLDEELEKKRAMEEKKKKKLAFLFADIEREISLREGNMDDEEESE